MSDLLKAFHGLLLREPKDLTDTELLRADRGLHELWRQKREGRPVRLGGKSQSNEDLINRHVFVIKEIRRRGMEHPLKDDFDEQTRPLLKSKHDLAPVHSSGVEIGPEITLAEVLPQVKSFYPHPVFAWIVGGLANRGRTKGDIDVLWRGGDDLPAYFKKILEFRFGRQFADGKLAARVQHHWDIFHGPFTKAVPIYALLAERINTANEVKEAGLLNRPNPPDLPREIFFVDTIWDDERDGWTVLMPEEGHELHKARHLGLPVGADGKCPAGYPLRRGNRCFRRPGRTTSKQQADQGLHDHPHDPDGTHEHPGLPAGGGHSHELEPKPQQEKYIPSSSPESLTLNLSNLPQEGPFVEAFGMHRHRPEDPLEGAHINRGNGNHGHPRALGMENFLDFTRKEHLTYSWVPGLRKIRLRELGGELREATKQDWQNHAEWNLHSAGFDLEAHLDLFVRPGRLIELEFEFEDGTRRMATEKDFRAEEAWFAERELVFQDKEVTEEGKTIFKANLVKQQDQFLITPPEDKTYRFVFQDHWRGRSVHGDLRFESVGKEFLTSWTLAHALAGKIKEPVDTFAKAKAIAKKDIYKIDWKTGRFKIRRTRAGVLVPAQLRAFQKAKQPPVWLRVEGQTKPFPAPGATRQFPGVFFIQDKGTVEYGTQKPDTHEYFLDGAKLQGRLVIRRIPRQTRKDFMEVDGYTCKVLPPGMIEEGPVVSRAFWVAIQPLDQTPIVLTERERKKFVPPQGISALPRKVRRLIPERFRYWLPASEKKRFEIRNALLDALKSKEIEIDFNEVILGKRGSAWGDDLLKQVGIKGRFSLQRQDFKGPVVVRFGPSRTIFSIRMDFGKQAFPKWELFADPIKQPKTSAIRSVERKNWLKFEGDAPPGHPLNPTKNTPSDVEILDEGEVLRLIDQDNFKRFEFKGKKLKGIWIARRESGKEQWDFEPSQRVAAEKGRVDQSTFSPLTPSILAF